MKIGIEKDKSGNKNGRVEARGRKNKHKWK